MSELRRWSEEGASPDELALLDAARSERANDRARKRTLGALGIGSSLLATSTAASALGTAGKLIGVAVAVGSLSVGGVVAHRSWKSAHHAESAPAIVKPAPPRPDSAITSAPLPTPSEPTPAPAPIPAPVPVPTPEIASAPPASAIVPLRAHPKGAAASPSLSREVVSLEQAHHALADHDADRALRALDRYRAQFPRGELMAEERVLRVQALLARGDREKAVAIANEYCQANPDSPYATRLKSLVKGLENSQQ